MFDLSRLKARTPRGQFLPPVKERGILSHFFSPVFHLPSLSRPLSVDLFQLHHFCFLSPIRAFLPPQLPGSCLLSLSLVSFVFRNQNLSLSSHKHSHRALDISCVCPRRLDLAAVSLYSIACFVHSSSSRLLRPFAPLPYISPPTSLSLSIPTSPFSPSAPRPSSPLPAESPYLSAVCLTYLSPL